MTQKIIDDCKNKMEKSIQVMQKDFSTVRTGRASSAILEGVKVSYYGAETPLLQLANIGQPDARTLEIKPYDHQSLVEIEKAILKSDLGLVPQNDGKLIRIQFPPLTEERRKELTKVVKKMSEDARIAVRSIRRDSNEKFKHQVKQKEISEDESKSAENKVQTITDGFIKKIDELVEKKEKEILSI
jgi:ribosome recycling factor